MPARLVGATFLLLAVASAGGAEPRVVMEPVEAEGENLLRADAWRPYGKGFTREGDVFVCDNGAGAGARRGVSQSVRLDQSEPRPIVATCWSKAEGVGGRPNADYSLYLDLVYTDGTPLWGQIDAFKTGTHGWERAKVVVFPKKPVRSLAFYMLLRRHAGKAVFKEPTLVEMTAPEGAALFDGLPVRVTGKIERGFLVRDVAAGSGVVAPARVGPGRFKALGLDLEDRGTFADAPKRRTVMATVRDTTGRDRAVTLYYVIPVAEPTQTVLVHTPQGNVDAAPPREYADLVRFAGVGAREQMSRWPLAAAGSMALVIDPDTPCFYRLGYSAGTRLLYAACDIGLAPEKPDAEVRFLSFQFEGLLRGFRGALETMYRLFPGYYRCRVPAMGLWMPFHKISEVQGWRDFGFAFKEGTNETAWDDARGITTFRYTEPMTWWMRMPEGTPRTYEAALAHAKTLAEKGDRRAKALLTSGCHDADGRFAVRFRDTPWCDGAVWSMNSMPHVEGEVTDFRNKWNAEVAERYDGEDAKGRLDGEYVDSSEGYVTDVLDFRRDHFAAARTPLVFESDTHRPAIFRGLIAFEYVRALEKEMRRRGRLMMANGAPTRLPWLVPLLDVCGTETNWNPGGMWRPMSVENLFYRRALCGPKPYCFLMNTRFEAFGPDLVERYMKRALAWGMFPGFFSHNASEGHYFSRPDLYNRDRPLFKKYVPLVKRVAEAGWQPVTRVASSEATVYVERWGERYLTVFNDSPERQTAGLTLEGLPVPPRCRDLVGGRDVDWAGGTARITLDAEDVALLDLAPAEP
ncbi:MAG: hypothetical protein R6X20_06985 [Phycisphaerae bacterium]